MATKFPEFLNFSNFRSKTAIFGMILGLDDNENESNQCLNLACFWDETWLVAFWQKLKPKMTILKVIFSLFSHLEIFSNFSKSSKFEFWFEIFSKNSMVPRWCSRDVQIPCSWSAPIWAEWNSWKVKLQFQDHEFTFCRFLVFFRFLSFDLKFLKPIGYTVCIPTNGRRLTVITWAAEECSTNEKPENRI